MKLTNNKSFSLVEVLVFVTIIGIFFVIAASVATFTLRSMTYNEHKIRAVQYADNLVELLRAQKEMEWGGDVCGFFCAMSTFTQKVTQSCLTANPSCTIVYCFNTYPSYTQFPTLGPCFPNDYSLGSIFKREAKFTSSGDYINQVIATITVSWLELGKVESVKSVTVFKVLEE